MKRIIERIANQKKRILFEMQLKMFIKNSVDNRFNLKNIEINPHLHDNTTTTNFDAHYIYHPAWAARVVRKIKPEVHVDFSSTLHFCSILSAFQKVKFYDYRPAELKLDNLESYKCDLNKLEFEDNSLDSISCMHTIEHIGLGRYGDKIDPNADYKAISELKRVTTQHGNLLIVVPIGKPKLVFNAHRIYSYELIIDMMEGFNLKEFSMIYDDNSFVENANPEDVILQNYACGCFWFVKN